MKKGSIARRYAQALIDLAVKEDQTDQISTELGQFQALIQQVPRLIPMLSAVVLSKSERRRILTEVLEQMEASDLLRRFTKYLLDRERFVNFVDIVRAYQKLCDQLDGLVRAKVVSAVPLDKAQTERLKKILEEKTGKKIAVEYSEDSSLIGGVTIQVGSRVYDGSVVGELARIQDDLMKEANR